MSYTHDHAVLFESAARTASADSAEVANYCFRGARFYLDITAVSGTTPTLDIKIQGYDKTSDDWYDLPGASFAQQTGTGRATLTVYPGIAETANETVSDVLPRLFKAVATIGGTSPSFTFTLSCDMFL